MRLAIAPAKAAGVHSAEGWELAGKPKRKDNFARKVTTISEAIPVYLNSKPLMV